uniref:Calponin-homology (CH) domain-containing protein n=1 Tax=Electrophorus electricus TaxID=8005 RepID=A0A4W4EA17_ELEEL
IPGLFIDENLDNTEEGVSRLELTLQCAVQEIHCDLKAFGKYVDVRLEEATAKVNPAIEAIATLQEENLRLRLQQEKLARQIEALCQALGLPEDHADPVPHPPTFSTRRSSSTPSLISSFSRSNSMVGLGLCIAAIFQVLPNEAASSSSGSKLTSEQLEAIQDEEILDKMLDDSKDFEERKMIRAAMRELRKKKRDQREKEREVRLQELRQQREERAQKDRSGAGEVVVRKVEKSVDGSTVSEITKTNRFAQSGGTMQTKSYSYSSSSSTKKVGSVFDREDDSALERRQAERRKELVRAQTLPKTSAVQARRAMMEKLDKDSGSPAQVNKVHRSTSFGVPNANSIKQMLLDWCRAKTRDYENVDIQNFSSSWSDGMAFCALVHNFFPEAFDYSALSPSNRRQNFEVAFKTAEKLADCPQLLDVDDMVRLREPDWKCVYTYLQEFYRGLVQKGLVKTKHST